MLPRSFVAREAAVALVPRHPLPSSLLEREDPAAGIDALLDGGTSPIAPRRAP